MKTIRASIFLLAASWGVAPANAQSSLSAIAAQYGVELVLPFSTSSANDFGPGIVLRDVLEGKIDHTRYLQSATTIPCSRRILTPTDESALNFDIEINSTNANAGNLAKLITTSFALGTGALPAAQGALWQVRRALTNSQPDNVIGRHLTKLSQTCPAILQNSSVVVQSAVTGDMSLAMKFSGAEEAQVARSNVGRAPEKVAVTEELSSRTVTISALNTIIGLHWLPVSDFTH
jgi:hypothetical protein